MNNVNQPTRVAPPNPWLIRALISIVLYPLLFALLMIRFERYMDPAWWGLSDRPLQPLASPVEIDAAGAVTKAAVEEAAPLHGLGPSLFEQMITAAIIALIVLLLFHGFAALFIRMVRWSESTTSADSQA